MVFGSEASGFRLLIEIQALVKGLNAVKALERTINSVSKTVEKVAEPFNQLEKATARFQSLGVSSQQELNKEMEKARGIIQKRLEINEAKILKERLNEIVDLEKAAVKAEKDRLKGIVNRHKAAAKAAKSFKGRLVELSITSFVVGLGFQRMVAPLREFLEMGAKGYMRLLGSNTMLGQKLTELGVVWKILGITIFAALEPVLTPIINFLLKIINRFSKLSGTQKTVLGAVIIGLTAILALFAFLAPVISAVIAIIGLMGPAGTVAVAPILLGMAAVIAIIIAVIVIITLLILWWKKHGEEVKEMLGNLWDHIKEFASNVWDGIKKLVGNIAEGFKEAFNIVMDIIGGVGKFIFDVFKFIWEFIKTGVNFVGTLFGKLAGAVGNIFTSIFDGLKSIFIGIVNFIIDQINSIIATGRDLATKLGFGEFAKGITDIERIGGGTVNNITIDMSASVSKDIDIAELVTRIGNELADRITTRTG